MDGMRLLAVGSDTAATIATTMGLLSEANRSVRRAELTNLAPAEQFRRDRLSWGLISFCRAGPGRAGRSRVLGLCYVSGEFPGSYWYEL